MALEQSRFYDSVSGDRKYQADQFAEYFRLFLGSGVRNGGTNLQVTADGTAMAVTVDYGEAMLYGYGYWLKDDNNGRLHAPIAPSGSQPRVDRVVIRLNRQLDTRTAGITVLQGEEAVSPVAPGIVRNGNTFDLSLAQVTVPANSLVIRAENVKDERLDQSVCGLMNSLITLDTEQLRQEFDAFMASIAQDSPVLHREVADDLVTTEAGKVLDARQGLRLQTQLDTHTGDKTVHITAAERTSWNDGKNKPGMVQPWAGNSGHIPAGWLLCDGTAVSRSVYAALYSVLGTTYGLGNGSTTFNVPDLTGRVPIGADGSYPLGSTAGSEEQNNAHDAGQLYAAIGAAGDDISSIGYSSGAPLKEAPTYTFAIGGSQKTNKKANHSTYVYGRTAIEKVSVMQPYTAMHYIIKY